MFCLVAVSCSAYQSVLKGSIIVVVTQYGSKLFELISKRIEAMAKIPKQTDRDRELREIVKLHGLAMEYVHHLESTISFVMINQIMNCILIWCLMMFYVSTVWCSMHDLPGNFTNLNYPLSELRTQCSERDAPVSGPDGRNGGLLLERDCSQRTGRLPTHTCSSSVND